MSLLLMWLVWMGSHAPMCHASSFSVGSSTLPGGNSQMAIVYDAVNDTVLLLGGSDYGTYLQGYGLTMFKDNESTPFVSDDVYFADEQRKGMGQYYTQLSTTLWMVVKVFNSDSAFYTFDTKTYESGFPSINISLAVDLGGCLTSTDDYLILIGGETTTVQIYALDKDEWLYDVPRLITPRSSLSCEVLQGKIYAIAGDNSEVLNTIEVLNISNMSTISSTAWYTFNCALHYARSGLRSAVYGTDRIYVVGGFGDFDNDYDALTAVDIINTERGECHVGPALAYSVAYAPCIIIGHTLFVFGGEANSMDFENRYQYLVLPTFDPTENPVTTDPSNEPTIQPSSSYDTTTNDPSPTEDPVTSNKPTIQPSYTTTDPSNEPTIQPSYTTTNDPVASVTYPIIPPTDYSMNPTNVPVIEPTVSPMDDEAMITTHNPTLLPSIESISTVLEPSHPPNIASREVIVPQISSTTERSSKENKVSKPVYGIWIIAVVIGTVICICGVVLYVVVLYRKRDTKKHVQHIQHEMIEKDNKVNGIIGIAGGNAVEMSDVDHNKVSVDAIKAQNKSIKEEDDNNNNGNTLEEGEVRIVSSAYASGVHVCNNEESEDEDILGAVNETINGADGLEDIEEFVINNDSDDNVESPR